MFGGVDGGCNFAYLYLNTIPLWFLLQEWKAQKDEEMKAELAQNARYKSYRRYMKKGGPGQMTFGPE